VVQAINTFHSHPRKTYIKRAQMHGPSTTGKHFDLTLIGCGGAGMCLLMALMRSGHAKRVSILIIEPQLKDKNDRTWCFWAKEDDHIVRELKSLLSNKWNNAIVNDADKPLRPYAYYHLESHILYAHVRKSIQDYPNITWVRDHVMDVKESNDSPILVSAAHASYTSMYVFDSRVTKNQHEHIKNDNGFLWQSFFGYRIKFKENILNTNAFHLMNFGIAQQGACQFVYILPFSSNEALAELTRFGSEKLTKEANSHLLKIWLNDRFGDYQIIDEEQGLIPMDLLFNPDKKYYPSDKRHILIGTPAGCVKSTTGYAFHAMFKYSNQIAEALANNAHIPTFPRPARHSFYDSLLLHILRERPAMGSRIFIKLFEKVPLKHILTFLDEKTTALAEIPILWALPKRIFLQALLKKIFYK
jgi:lycopene beta-cyclase